MFAQKLHSAHQKARSTVAALQAVAVAERLLYGMKLSISHQPLHRQLLSAVSLESEQRARLHGPAIKHHSAGAAIAGIAADVGAREVQLFPEKMNQEQPRL